MFLNKNLTRWLTVALLVMFVFTLGYAPASRRALADGSQPVAVIDAGHANIYTANGSYPNSGTMMKTALQAKGFNVVVNTGTLTSSVLSGAKVLIITDPGKTSVLSSDEMTAVTNYVYAGGNLIVTCSADYGDGTGAYASSAQGNAVLQTLGSDMRFNDDELTDSNPANQVGSAYKINFSQYEAPKYNLVKSGDTGLPFRMYSGSSVYLQVYGNDSAIDWMVKPNSTTSGTDSDHDGRVTPPDGQLHMLGAEQLAGGGKLVAAGTTFFSDYELGDSSLSNSNIFNNIIDWFQPPAQGPVQVAGAATDATVAMTAGNTTVSSDSTWTIKISSGTVRDAVYASDLAMTGLPAGLTDTAAKVPGANSILITVSGTASPPVTTPVNVSIVVKGSAVTESGATASGPIQVQVNPATFDIVEVTDLHGTLETTSGTPVAAELAENVSDVVFANNPTRTLILSGGDNYQGTAMSNLEYGKPVMQVFNAMGVAASAVGNHEFDWGLDKVTGITQSVYSNYPFVCANLFYKGTNNTVFDPYQIFTLDGEKIAVVGGLTEDTPNIVLADNIAPYDVRSNVTCVNAAAADARAHGAQVVIALIHEGDNYNNGASGPIVDIAKQLTGVDAVLGGHTHSIVNTTVTTNAGATIPLEIGNAYGCGFIDLKFYLGGDGKPVFTNANSGYYPEDTGSTAFPFGYKAASPKIDGAVAQQVYQIVAQTKLDEGPILNEVLGSAAITLTRAQAVSPCGESLAGNWSTDVIRNKVNADFGFMNNGGLRIDIPQGTITYSTMLAFQPFGNTITTCNMTGAQVKTVLEEALTPQSGYPDGRGVQISGLKFSYDMTQPVGSRVFRITKSDGTPVNMTGAYRVATNNFVSGGGDGFVVFKNVASTDTGIDVMQACSAAVTAAGASGITAAIEGRIASGNANTYDTVSKITATINGDPAGAEGFTWYTGSASGASDLQVEPNAGTTPDWSQAAKFSGAWTASTNSPGERVHKAEATGLQANTSYRYRVGDATLDVWSAVGTFQTAPTSGAFTFVDLADTQALDEGEATLSSQTIANALATVSNAKFLALNGDIVEDGNNEQEWNWMLNQAQASLLGTTIVPVAGNHDATTNAFIQHFDLEAPNSQDTAKGDYYSYNYSNAHFIVLNTNDSSADYADFSPAQLQWMQSDVQAARAAGAKWIIAVLHKGPYTTANHATDSDIAGATGLRAKVAPAMASLGIDLVLQGHDHIYARSKPIKADGAAAAETQITETFNGQGIKYIVNPSGSIYLIPGAAGAKVYYKSKTIDPSYFNLFDNADENHAAQYGPDPNDTTRPERGQIQTFESITVDGGKLSVISYEIDQNKNNAQPYVMETFGIEKQSGVGVAPAAPTITPNGGYFTNTQTVGIGNIPAGDMACYTLDGSAPTVYSYVYSRPFTLTGTTTVTAAAFDPATGLWSTPVTATFTKGTAGATIRSIAVLDANRQPVTGPLTHGRQYYLSWRASKNSDGALPGLAIVEALDANNQAVFLNAATFQVSNSPDTEYTVLFQSAASNSYTVKGFFWNDWSTSATWQPLATDVSTTVTVN